MDFSYAPFWQNPFSTLALFSLIMAFLSLWVYNRAWVWMSFLLIFSVLGYQSQVVAPIAFIPLVILGGLYGLIKSNPTRWRWIWILGAIILSLGLLYHWFPGFYEWKISGEMAVSDKGLPYIYSILFDVPFIGLFPLALIVPLIQEEGGFAKWMKMGIPLAVIGVGLITLFGWYIGLFAWDPKFPVFVGAHFFTNLFLFVIPIEGFLRGFVQNQIYLAIGRGVVGGVGAVLIGAIFSVLMLLGFISSMPMLLFIFFSSLIYGAVFQVGRCVESSMMCHGLFNLVHLFLFTYPALA